MRQRDDEIVRLSEVIDFPSNDAEQIQAYFKRAVEYKRLGDLDKALADFRRVAQAVPGLGAVYVHSGECLLIRGDHELAIVALDRAIALLPASAELAVTYLNRGLAHAALGDVNAAFADFDKAIEIAPEVERAVREEQSKLRKRLDTKGTASQRERNNESNRGAESFIGEGWLRNRQGDLVDSLVAFCKAIEIRPSHHAYYGRGIVNCKLRRYGEAIADLNRAIKIRPLFPEALTERGLAYVRTGDIERGLKDYDAAIGIDPSYAMAHINKGSAYCLNGQLAEALPYLDTGLRLAPRDGIARYNRSTVYETMGKFSRAIKDLEIYLSNEPNGPAAAEAKERLPRLRRRSATEPEPERFPMGSSWIPSVMESIWTQFIMLSPDDTVADLVQRVHAEGAFFGVIKFSDGRVTVAPVYGEEGLRRHLTDIADAIGENILALKLKQFHNLFLAPAVESVEDKAASQKPDQGDGERLVQGRTYALLKDGEQLRGVFSDGIDYHFPDLPTVLFGERPRFGRSERSDTSRTCSACRRTLGYFNVTFEADMLTGYVCPYCGVSPILSWVEARMRPGCWSRHGFLGETEWLEEIIAEDNKTLKQLGVRHAQIAEALDQLLAGALVAYADRISLATRRFMDEMVEAGMRGVPGEAVLRLGVSLDEIEECLHNRKQIPEKDGVILDAYHVFLQVYLGYQYCPFTVLRLPWSDEVPRLEVIRRRGVGNIVYHTAPTDRRLPCQSHLSYRYGNVEFLIVRKDHQWLRGSGLMVHLIGDHRFFEGKESPFRLDPEQAARVLGLC